MNNGCFLSENTCSFGNLKKLGKMIGLSCIGDINNAMSLIGVNTCLLYTSDAADE